MSTSLTLYQLEDTYQALLDTEAMVPPALEAEFQQLLHDALFTTVEKRERVAQFLLFLMEGQEQVKKERERLARRNELFANTERRMRRYIAMVIKDQGRDAKGEYRKLIAHTATMFLRALPASIDVTDEDEVPDEYKNITITMPLDLWRRLTYQHNELMMHDTMGIQIKTVVADKERIREAIEHGADVPGADLKLAGHDYSLVVK